MRTEISNQEKGIIMNPSFIRRIDALSRVVLPTELRQQAGINADTDLFLACAGNTNTIRPISTVCSICGEPASFHRSTLPLCDTCYDPVKDRYKA